MDNRRIAVSGTNNLALWGAKPSAAMLKMRTAIAVATTVATRLTPTKRRRLDRRHTKLNIANANGNAPNPMRVVVSASPELRVTPVAAEARTGSVMYRKPTVVKISVAAANTSLFIQGAKREKCFIVVSPLSRE
jgi:hypothetical protein